MASQVAINLTADTTDAQQSIRNAIQELKGLAAAANEGSTIAQNAFRAEAAEIKTFATSLGATSAQIDQINQTTQRFEQSVASADRTAGRMASSTARGFSILATQATVSTRSVDMLVSSVANLAFGMTGAAAYLGAGAIAVFGLARMFTEAQEKAEKLRMEMDKLAFDDNLSESLSKQHELQLTQIEDIKKLTEARIKAAVVAQTMGGDPFSLLGRGISKAIGQDPVSRAQKALDQITAQLTQIDALVDKQAAEEDTREKAHQKVLDDEEAAHKRMVALRRVEAELARETAENDKKIAKFANDLVLDMRYANEVSATGQDPLGAAEAAPGSKTRPMSFRAPNIDAMEQLIKANGRVGASFVLMANQAQDAFERTGKWAGVATQALSEGFHSAVDAIVSGKGNLKQVEQALAEPWVKSLEARAEYDFAMAASNWMNPPIAAKYLGSAALDIAGAAAISRILDMGGSSSGGGRGSSGGAGAASAQLGANSGATYQQQTIDIVVSGDLKLDGRTVANLNSKLTRIADRNVPARSVL